jgi:hypothetical protein
MGRRIGAALALLAAGAQAQMVTQWLPARVELHAGLADDSTQVRVIEGVPGEVLRLRVVPKGTATAKGWAADLLQPDEDTQTYFAGTGGAIVLDQVQFGSDGAVVLRLRCTDGAGGKFVLRGRSQLPVGFSHPQVELLAGAPGVYATSTPMRPGLTLRARVKLPHAAQGWPQQSLPHVLVTPPALVGEPYETGASLPGKVTGQPYPDLVKLKEEFDFAHVQFDLGAEGLTLLGVRVRGHKTVLGKPSKHGPIEDASPAGGNLQPPTFLSVQLDADELLPGETAHLTAAINSKPTQCPEPTASVRVWLSSVHRIDYDDFGGWLLAGPVEMPGVFEGFTFESDITVPADVPPGLYGVWVVLDEPGGPIFGCENLFNGQRAVVVLKVRAP